jgi:molecular chaperone GrpE
MSEQDQKQTAADETQDLSAEQMSDADADAEAAPLDEVAELQQQIGELKERMLRAQAEFDNVRKRLRREADEAGTRAVARFCRPVLDQIDNLTRAINAANPEAFADFAQGVSMIREGLNQALAGQGIEVVSAEGVFDPAVHEVLAELENGDQPKGTILEVHRAGYKIKDQLVRSAQVIVARPPA